MVFASRIVIDGCIEDLPAVLAETVVEFSPGVAG
jgi:hypothetical protein